MKQEPTGDEILKEWRQITEYFRLPLRCSRGIRSSGVLNSVGWYLVTDVSTQHVSPVFKGETKQNETRLTQTAKS